MSAPSDRRPVDSENAAAQSPDAARILIVDDAREIVLVLDRVLTKAGYETLTASDGNEALELARRELPDLLLLDWMLPGVEGIEVCRQLKADPQTRGIMILLVTGRGTVNQRVQGFDAGADDYIPKPFNNHELLARVRSALRIKRLTDELSERNRQLLKSQSELVRAEKMATIGLLASGIAHEFNNIMAGISGYAQLAKRDEKHRERLIDVTLTQSERALELTRSLSAYHHRDKMQEDSCDLQEIVEGSLCLVHREIESNGITVETDLCQTAPVAISPGRLQDVVLNLLINAIHAIEGQGNIRLATRSESPEECITFEVSDSGQGIAPEDLGRIFDPFFTTKGALGGGSVEGSGLGLSVCYNAVTSCGGQIAVESEPGVGTTFRMTLPVARETADDNEDSGLFTADLADTVSAT